MIKNKFYRKGKLTVFVFHLAFAVILLGAAITRFISYEGLMHIREGETVSSMLSSEAYMDVTLTMDGESVESSKKVMLSALTPRDYRNTMKIAGQKVKIKSTGFLDRAVEQYVAQPGGEPYVQLIMVSDRQTSVGIPSGQTRNVMGLDISLNSPDTTALLRLVTEGNELIAYAHFKVTSMQMGGASSEEYEAGTPVPIKEGTLYTLGHMRMALQRFIPSARRQLVNAPAGSEGNYAKAVRLEINYKGMTSEVYVTGMPKAVGIPVRGQMGDLGYTIVYGSREVPVPFSIRLRDFQVERYPGSNSPSSFASEVTLIDNEMGINEDHRIFMNNVLKHRGYRFYQASYDTDEMGTVLSVNKDWWGTTVTYLGYFLLMAGMLLSLFTRGTRFAAIARKSARAVKTPVIILLLLAGSVSLSAQELVPPKDIAADFGQLWVQDKGGRFKPVNTLSSEVVRKITKQATFRNFTSDQVLLGMILYPQQWQQIPLFEVKSSGLQQILGYKGDKISFSDLMDPETSDYLLADAVNEAYSKQVAMQDDMDKEVIKLDDRVNAMYLVQSGGILRIFPDSAAENNRWTSVSDALMGNATPMNDSMAHVFLHFLNAIQQADYNQAEANLSTLSAYQQTASDILPSVTTRKIERMYNRVNIFERLGKFYGIMGVLLVILQFVITFKPGKTSRILFKIGVLIIGVGFAFHTLGLAARWYVSGHAPLSNGYESMLFISWATMLAGIIFANRSGFAVALTSILSALALMVAHMSWMNPEITNLVPVLKSPWLTIHVTVIMAGYGFLGLASLLGFMNLIFYSILGPSNKQQMNEVIIQITRVIHLTMIVGLYFMTAGVFLGGVWANESWGRYWGWDPKETWALITVLVYAFVAHMHKIPGLRGNFAFNLSAFIGYASVMMTYFGVNYFLGGIHSYASGSPFAFPWYTYAIIVGFVVFAIFAFYRHRAYLPDTPEQVGL